jgi:hypothetical protein
MDPRSDAPPFDLRVILGDPARVREIPREQLAAAIVHASSVMAALAAVVATHRDSSGASEPEDRLLTLDEAADLANVSVRWLRRHRQLPIFVSLSRKNLRVSEKRLRQYLERRWKM